MRRERPEMASAWVRLAREVVTGRRNVTIESTMGAYSGPDGLPSGRPLIFVSVVNAGRPLVRLAGAALSLNHGGTLPFFTSRLDLPHLPRLLS
jgi:hypothetical protein